MAIPPINQTSLEGEEAQFNCVAKDKDTVIKWYKDGQPLKDLQDLLQRSWLLEDGSLSIRPTTMSDYGEYECVATNPTGEMQTAKAFLNVQCKYLRINKNKNYIRIKSK